MRIVLGIILTALLLFLGSQLWYFYGKGAKLENDLREREAELSAARQEYETLRADYDYYKNTANIEKELRGRFNYKEPGETVMVIVPRDGQSSTTSTVP